MWIVSLSGTFDDLSKVGADIYSDTSPFKLLARADVADKDILFIDVDYPDLIKKKCEVISKTPSLRRLLRDIVECSNSDTVLFRSKRYMAIGCDLRDLVKLTKTLEVEELDQRASMRLILAEVSLTYIEVSAADRLIKWAGGLQDGTR